MGGARIHENVKVTAILQDKGRVTRGRDAPKVKRATLNGRRVKTLRASKRRFRIVVRDAAGESWKFNLRR